MNKRIEYLRKEILKMSMEKFGDRIGISKSAVNQIEKGKNTPSEQTVVLICKEFNIEEDWLRNGNGEMKKKRTRSQEIGAFVADIINMPPDSAQVRFLSALQKLDSQDWEAIERIMNKIIKED